MIMSRYPLKYDTSIRKELDKADWDSIYPVVLKYAISRAKIFSWLGDEVNPENLVQEAMARAYGIGSNGTYRNWNKEKYPELQSFLISIIRSMTSHVAEHESEFPKESLLNVDGLPKDKKLLESRDEIADFQNPKTPEEELIETDNLKPLMEELSRLSNENEELGMVILCIQDGISRPRHIADETGYDIKKVNNLLRTLRRRLAIYDPKLNK